LDDVSYDVLAFRDARRYKGGGCLETLLTSKRFGVNPGRFGDLVLGIRLPGNELKDFLFVLMF